MMNRLFRVLVLTSLPGGSLACGDVENSPPDDSGASGSGGALGSGAEAGGGHSGSGGDHRGTGGTSGGGTASGGTSTGGAASGGASSGGTSTGGALPPLGTGGEGDWQADPETLPCPAAQWDCREADCVEDMWVELSQCRCDDSRPQSEADCDEGEVFLCNILGAVSPSDRAFSCACVPQDSDPGVACSMTIAVRGVTSVPADEGCNCAYLLIR